MKITNEEFEAVEDALGVALGEGMLNEDFAYSAFDKMKEVYKRYRFLMYELKELSHHEGASWILTAYKKQFGEDND